MKKIIILIIIVFTQNVFSQTNYIPTKENLEARKMVPRKLDLDYLFIGGVL